MDADQLAAVGSVVFFFQAEDGIRDYKLTGVQTCALPISAPARRGARRRAGRAGAAARRAAGRRGSPDPAPAGRRAPLRRQPWLPVAALASVWAAALEIGRASCRERV